MYIVTADADIIETGKGLHGEKKDFVNKNKRYLQTAYLNYETKARNNELHLLVPIWQDEVSDTVQQKLQKDKKRKLVHNLYSSKKSIVRKHWDELKRINGGENILCPICGVNLAKEMDHYIPRENMPEFSVYRNNLIPLCHDCNHDKSSKWLGNDGHRLFFNAFYDGDNLPENIIDCRISLDETRTPCVEVVLSQSLNREKEIDKLIISTIRELNLLDKYTIRAKEFLRRMLLEIKARYEKNYSKTTSIDFWNNERDIYQSCKTSNKADFIYNALYDAVYASPDILTWISSLTFDIKHD